MGCLKKSMSENHLTSSTHKWGKKLFRFLDQAVNMLISAGQFGI